MRTLRTVFRTSWLLAAGLTLAACSDRGLDTAGRAEPDEGDRMAANIPDMPPEPDNTARNARDADGGTLTPEDQSNEQRDLDIARSIREAVASNDALSTNAQNVKIITQDAVVTLRGPVKSEQEKAIVVSIAQQTPGVARVDDQLEVDPQVEVETEFEHEYEEER
jgi:hypothetical protein